MELIFDFGKFFDVGNSSSRHSENCKNSFLIPGKRPTDDINDSVGEPEKRFSIDFSKSEICKFKGLYNLTPIGFV